MRTVGRDRGRSSRCESTIDNPLQAHVDQLGKYTDKDMHDVFAYLQSLK